MSDVLFGGNDPGWLCILLLDTGSSHAVASAKFTSPEISARCKIARAKWMEGITPPGRITVNMAEQRYGFCTGSLRAAVVRGEIPFVKAKQFSFVLPEDVEKWMAEHGKGSAA